MPTLSLPTLPFQSFRPALIPLYKDLRTFAQIS